MKKFKGLIFLVLLLGFFALGAVISAKTPVSGYKPNPYRKFCLGINVTFNQKNWTGGAVQIGCGGDDMLALPKSKRPTEGCSGETHTIKPGETFRLTKCSCQGSQGCLFIAKKLKVGPLNNQGHSPIVVVTPLSDVAAFKKCTLKAGGDVVPHAKTNVCGTNGNHISTNFSIKCNVPSSTPTFTPTPTPTSRITVTPTFTPTPTGPVCITPEPVLNVKITCPNCNQGPTPTVAITPTETPIPPTPTFTITPTPTGGSQ